MSELDSTAQVRQAIAVATKDRRRTIRERFARGEVEWSEDLQRVMAVPRRSKPKLGQIVEGMTAVLKRPEGTQRLRDLQAWILWEFPQAGGGIAMIQTGAGKTLCGMLMPMVWPYVRQKDGKLRPPRVVLFLRSDLRPQFEADWEFYGQHWRLPNLAGGKYFTPGLPNLHVVSYSELQQPTASAFLDELQPDLVLCDEVSSLRNFESVRCTRVRRHFAQRPDTALCGWDATVISDSLEDSWHLFAYALDESSPIPLKENEVRKWARAVDPESYDDGYWLPGALTRLCEAGEPLRSGLRRRIMQTKGIIASEENLLGIPLIMAKRFPPVIPEDLVTQLKLLRRKKEDGGWRRPDGEELTEAVEVHACACQLACGFFLRWRYPRGEPAELIEDWFMKRQHWNRELRAALASPRVHLDSKKLYENAAARWFDGGCPGCQRGPLAQHSVGCLEKETHPLWPSYTFQNWRAIKDQVHHVTEAVWVSEWLLHDAAAWAKERPGIVWVEYPEFGHRMEKLFGLKYYGEGKPASQALLKVDGSTSIVVSINAHLRGKNLQMFSRNLLVSFPASNDTVEQSLGRTYREGQKAERVEVDYYLHTRELENAFEKAKVRAKFVHEMLGTSQKLVYAQHARAA